MSDLSNATPEGWIVAPLQEVVTLRSERVNPQSMPDLPYIGMEHVEPHTNRIIRTVPASSVTSSAARFCANDVLYGRMRPYLNKVAQPRFAGLASGEFMVFAFSTLLNPTFLQLRLTSADFVEFALSQISGDRPRVKFEQLKDFAFALPPLREQHRIVEKLEELLGDLDAGVGELRAAQGKLKLYRQSLLKAAVTGKLTADWREQANAEGKECTETGASLLTRILEVRRQQWADRKFGATERAGQINRGDLRRDYREPLAPDLSKHDPTPESWALATIGQLGDVQLGRQRSPDKLTGLSSTKYIRAANITELGIDFSDVLEMDFSATEKSTFRLRQGDVLLTEASGSAEHVGRPAIWPNAEEIYCFQNTVLRFRPTLIGSRFAFYVFLACQKLGRFVELAGGVGINHLSAGKFSAIPVPLPSLDEQDEIVELLDSAFADLDRQGAAIAHALRQSEAQRKNILQAAFSGQLVPQDPNDEPASVLLERIRASRADKATAPTRRPRKAREPA